MSNGPWTDEENDLIVADYFAMLADDIMARRYNKAEHRRALLPLLNDRTDGSVEFKRQNISAVLKGLGENWIPGYKPTFNFQMTLIEAVMGAHALPHQPQRAGRGRGAAVGMVSVPALEFRPRAEGVRVAPATGRACLADHDELSGQLPLMNMLLSVGLIAG